MRAFWFDVETTGLEAGKNDITQLAYQLVFDDKVVVENNILMRPLNPENITDEALRIQGRTKDEVMAFPPAAEGYATLTKDLGKHIDKFDRKDKVHPGGYNVFFDYQFLTALPRKLGYKYGLGSFLNHMVLDPLFIINILIGLGAIKQPINRKLATMCEFFGISLEDAHDAAADLKAARELFFILADRLIYAGTPLMECTREKV